MGALVLDLKDFASGTASVASPACIIAGMLVAGVSGYFAIKFLLNIVRRHSLGIFSVYCVIAGIVAIILNFTM